MSIEWAAGLFEGEGSLTKHSKRKASWMLRVEMTDLDVVENFQNVIGYGTITLNDSPSRHKIFNRKPSWIYRLCSKSHIRSFLVSVLPLLGNRRAHKALDCLDNYELE